MTTLLQPLLYQDSFVIPIFLLLLCKGVCFVVEQGSVIFIYEPGERYVCCQCWVRYNL